MYACILNNQIFGMLHCFMCTYMRSHDGRHVGGVATLVGRGGGGGSGGMRLGGDGGQQRRPAEQLVSWSFFSFLSNGQRPPIMVYATGWSLGAANGAWPGFFREQAGELLIIVLSLGEKHDPFYEENRTQKPYT
jgi:hypothetical protein